METRKHRQNAARRVIASLAVAAALGTAPAAHAAIIGGITISGTRYVDGVPTKVRCSAADGNTIDASLYGVRLITLINTPDCPIWWDSGLSDQFKFVGKEDHIIKNGVPTETLDFSGVQTLNGPGGAADKANGAVSAILKCVGPTCVSEKGSITYSRTDGSNEKIIFVGTYKAGF
jgi:hypothetical protein